MREKKLLLQDAFEVLETQKDKNFAGKKSFFGVKIDSRQIVEGDIFVAIRGERVDGHKLLQEAIRNGAVAIVVELSSGVDENQYDVPIIAVPSTKKAFGQLAGLWRKELFRGKVIALTGSNGKTTIKNMIAKILQVKYKAQCTRGNYNNEFGLPITIFELSLDCDYWVLEMGARHSGDISYLCDIAMPNITLISNIGNAHIGEFGGREKQVQAKSAILRYGELSLVDVDSPFYEVFLKTGLQNKNKKWSRMGRKKSHNLKSADIDLSWNYIAGKTIFSTPKGQFGLQLNCLGEHNAHNASWAFLVAYHCGLSGEDIILGLENVYPEEGRLQLIKIGKYTVINDSYNASPESVEAMLAATNHLSGKKIVVWGDMAELGDRDTMNQCHRQMAEKFDSYAIDWVLTYGDFAHSTKLYGEKTSTYTKYQHSQHLEQIAVLIKEITQQWLSISHAQDSIYVYLKASNKMQLSQLIPLIKE
jgi:UDP-N-acetylmuramoyl-tripeptide--D-alanyl-D-alanine ligase